MREYTSENSCFNLLVLSLTCHSSKAVAASSCLLAFLSKVGLLDYTDARLELLEADRMPVHLRHADGVFEDLQPIRRDELQASNKNSEVLHLFRTVDYADGRAP